MNRDKSNKTSKQRLKIPAVFIVFTLLFLNCMIYFTSCVSRSAVRESQLYVYLADNSKFFLLSPEEIEKPMDMVQYISASYNNRDYFLNVWVKADITEMEMTLLNEMGSNMGELLYRDGSVTFSSPVFPRSLRPEYIIADFQLCFYNPLPLREALEKCGLVFEARSNTRRIFKGKDLIIEIEKTTSAVRLVNQLRGYAYILKGDFE